MFKCIQGDIEAAMFHLSEVHRKSMLFKPSKTDLIDDDFGITDFPANILFCEASLC